MPAGTVVASGSLVSPGGQQGIPGPGQNASWQGFVSKTSAYTLTSADSAKYIICSGGSWTLTLPAAAPGLIYYVRNDQGANVTSGAVVSGTTGTITLAPTGGVIDGAATLALLPGQECMILTDGSNWRTFGRQRNVVIGTFDISSTPSTVSLFLPVGYRAFELDITGLTCSSSGYTLIGYFSTNGGASWDTASHYSFCYIQNSSTSAVGGNQGNQNTPYAYFGPPMYSALASVPPQGKLTIYPGNASVFPSWLLINGGYSSLYQTAVMYGWDALTGPINALQLAPSAGTFTGGGITVKGVV